MIQVNASDGRTEALAELCRCDCGVRAICGSEGYSVDHIFIYSTPPVQVFSYYFAVDQNPPQRYWPWCWNGQEADFVRPPLL